MAQPVRSWLSALGLAHLAEPLFEANITTMVAVCKLKDGDLLSLGVKLPEERALLLDRSARRGVPAHGALTPFFAALPKLRRSMPLPPPLPPPRLSRRPKCGTPRTPS